MGTASQLNPLPPGQSIRQSLDEAQLLGERRAIFRLIFIVGIVLGSYIGVAAGRNASDLEKDWTPGEHKHLYHSLNERNNAYLIQIVTGIAGLMMAAVGAAGLCGVAICRWLFLIGVAAVAVMKLLAFLNTDHPPMSTSHRTMEEIWGYFQAYWLYPLGMLTVGVTFPVIAAVAVLATPWPRTVDVASNSS